MIRRFTAWVQGWTATLDIRFNNPELYRELTQRFTPEDLVEVSDPTERH
jgi:hypothetical protein